MKRGRPPANGQPATAWEYRRYIALVQALAMEHGKYDAVFALSEAWGVEPVYAIPGLPYIMVWPTIVKLAQHVIEYHRKEREE